MTRVMLSPEIEFYRNREGEGIVTYKHPHPDDSYRARLRWLVLICAVSAVFVIALVGAAVWSVL